MSASVLIVVATFAALRGLARSSVEFGRSYDSVSFLELLTRWELVRIYLCAAGSFSLFSSVFNYLPFRLTGPPFNFSTQLTTLLYLSYIVGIFMGPTAGRISNRYGSGNGLLAGSIVLGGALVLIGLPSILAVAFGLFAICAGFFTVHAAAVGSLNRRLSSGQGRANALYVLFYYVGGWVGITGSGFANTHGGWSAVISICALLLLIPLSVGIAERGTNRRRASAA